jgi:hydrogenase maturation protein HypF
MKRTEKEASQRLRVVIGGAVQGVGFRPFVYQLATELDLAGWVSNSSQGVLIEVEGRRLQEFLLRLDPQKPPRSFIQSLESSFLDPTGYTHFEIRASDESGEKTALILPDIATCRDCLADIFAPDNRRYLYPLTNCTNCGPRFSIIDSLPYDRSNTTMKRFEMCKECRAEYHDPLDRRFHAQINACPRCGPHLELWTSKGQTLHSHNEALPAAADAVCKGQIVALKGLGGFHLIADARSDDAVEKLRRRKNREEKPFALMYPSLEATKHDCEVSEMEERLLLSPASPIVLLRRKMESSSLSDAIAPRNPYLGVMLAYTPLHHLLMDALRFPVVATSGNLSDEPVCTDEREALERLGDIADVFLIHNRPIARHADDSIARVMAGREILLRRARGYAPLPVRLKHAAPPILVTGAHLKNTIAVSVGEQVFISQHIGDLETAEAFDAFKKVIADFKRLYDVAPSLIACDAHPDYLSTRFARQTGIPARAVQHHFAHVLSCMAENEIEAPTLGVAWDGAGYGTDGTVWGGEFLRINNGAFERAAHFRTFRLPGGERAIREPRRAALGLLYEIFGDELFSMSEFSPLKAFQPRELKLLRQMMEKKINSPITSSAGRLFDAVASITGLRQEMKFEGQAAMELEFALDLLETDEVYTLRIADGLPMIFDWEPMVLEIISDVTRAITTGKISAKFHNTLVEAIVAIARRAGEERIVLTGGCFQNRYLTERAVSRLLREGFRPYWHQRVPPNDGGIALGQAAAMRKERKQVMTSNDGLQTPDSGLQAFFKE